MSAKRAILALLAAGFVAGCSVPGPNEAPDGIHDPYEAQNRRVHAFNRGLDRAVLAPAGKGYARVVPQGVQDNVSNLADTVSLPGTIVNQILQGRPGDATRNSLRFAINATLGFGGLADVASDLGLQADDSDFGETLHVWGAPEGAYVELPVLGPSTERDAVGEVVDFFTNPLDYALSRNARRAKTGLRVVKVIGDRGRYGDTVDSILYDSADSYSQLRVIYLQNRRFELDGAGSDEGASYIDPNAIDTEGF